MIVRRASTFYGRINLTNENGDGIILSDSDYLIFSVKKSLKTNNANNIVIHKTLHEYDQINGSYPCVLSVEDTDIPSGNYFYDVGLQCSNGEFYHVTMPDLFIIKESIARKEN